MDPEALGRVVAAAAEGYAFPTNLDRDQPVDGMAPPTQADLLRRALDEEWEPAVLRAALAEQSGRRSTAALRTEVSA